MEKVILSRHVYIGDRCKPYGCVDHGVRSMRVAKKISCIRATPGHAVVQPNHFCVPFKLLDEAGLASSTADLFHKEISYYILSAASQELQQSLWHIAEAALGSS